MKNKNKRSTAEEAGGSLIKIEQLVIFKLIELINKHNEILEDNNSALKFDGVVFSVNIKTFSELIKTMKEKELFFYVNKILADISIPVKDSGGMIYQYIGSGFNAFFMNQPENALRAALKVCGYIRGYETGALSLCLGSIMIGLIGENEDVMPMVISETAGLAAHLQQAALQYYSKIIVTGSFSESIEDFDKKFLRRYIGYIYIKSADSYEKLYDVFQADEPDVLWLKKKTRLMFEEGVRLYTSFKYKMARLRFIEVLKVFKEDSGSKHYLYMCDNYLKAKQGRKKEIYIDMY